MKFPVPLKITSRASTISNVFVQAIIPFEQSRPDQFREALAHLGMTPETRSCCYCGDKATDWDHLRPLVRNKAATGYISNYKNLVPACAPCNQSKSGADWEVWMRGPAKGSPATRKIADIELRIDRLRAFVRWGDVRPIAVEAVVDPELFSEYKIINNQIISLMKKAQEIAEQIRVQVLEGNKK